MYTPYAGAAGMLLHINRSGQTKVYKIGICCFSTKHAALRRKSKDWLAWNQDNVSEWGDISICWPGIRIMCPSGVTYLSVGPESG